MTLSNLLERAIQMIEDSGGTPTYTNLVTVGEMSGFSEDEVGSFLRERHENFQRRQEEERPNVPNSLRSQKAFGAPKKFEDETAYLMVILYNQGYDRSRLGRIFNCSWPVVNKIVMGQAPYEHITKRIPAVTPEVNAARTPVEDIIFGINLGE